MNAGGASGLICCGGFCDGGTPRPHLQRKQAVHYDRFLDIHFVTSRPSDLSAYSGDPEKLAAKTAAQLLPGYQQGQYQYDFQNDRPRQRRAYEGKLQEALNQRPAEIGRAHV